MNKAIFNYGIRREIENFIKDNGSQDTRLVIATFSEKYNTTKQRISGNLSCMKCLEKSIKIISTNKHHSVMY